MRFSIKAPDGETFNDITNLLRDAGAQIALTSNKHIKVVVIDLSDDLRETVERMGATVTEEKPLEDSLRV